MGAAGLTHGGFYRHFEDKDALMLTALEAAFAERHAALEHRFDESEPADAVALYHEDYLSDGHVGAAGIGCPAPTLAGDVAPRRRNAESGLRANVRRVIVTLSRGMRGSDKEREAQAARELAMLAGAIALARASDTETAKLILAACREQRGAA